jgi:glycosyltransferase involved in cell wall biosynthesis
LDFRRFSAIDSGYRAMNIWIFNHYADTPDRLTTRTYDLSKPLVARGHRVTIFAAGFNHYSFREERVQPGNTWSAEDWNGVRFVWIKTFPYHENSWRRVVNMLSYAWRALWISCRFSEKPDVVIGVSVHPLAALVGWMVSVFKRSRFFFELTDLWPEVLIDFGMLSSSSPITWALRVWEKFLYRRAKKIIMIWPLTALYVARYGIPPERIVWIPHSADLARYQKLPPYDGTIGSCFKVMYLGHFANSTGMDVIIDAAAILQKRGRDDIRFVLVGGGSYRERLMALSERSGLQNVEFRNVVPKADIASVMGEADAFIATLKDVPLLKYGISLNKICDYLASGRPTILVGKPGFDPIQEASAGISVPANDAEGLVAAIQQLISLSPEQRMQMGDNGRNYVKKYHDVEVLADRLERVLLSPSDPREVRSSDVLRSEFKSTERPSV